MGNFWTSRSRGMHPTPSACFPPPPPPADGTVSGFVNVDHDPLFIGEAFTVDWLVFNARYPPGEIVDGTLTTPGLNPVQTVVVQNDEPGDVSGVVTGPVGNYTATLRIEWPNGQIHTFRTFYTVLNP